MKTRTIKNRGIKKVFRDPMSFPQKEFDLIKEGTISLVIVTVLVVAVAALWGAPYRPAVTNQSIAKQNPVLLEQSALRDLDGTSTMASYGPPYNNGWNGNAQSIQSLGPFHPQTWWGTPYPLNTAQDDVLTPLSMLAKAGNNQPLTQAIATYQAASPAVQQQWDNNLNSALSKAKVVNGVPVLAQGNYGPVALMMQDELLMAQSGLLSGALTRETNNGVYRWNVQNNLLFLQGQTLHQIAGQINMKGEQWGINHDEQAYPGPWWLTPYTFLYQVPPWSTISAGDELAAYTVGFLFVLLILLPWIPGLNRLPRWLPLYKLIWRDWYKRDLNKDEQKKHVHGKKGLA